MYFSNSFAVTLKRLLRSPLTLITALLLVVRYLFDAAGPDNWIEVYIKNGWNTQFYNNATYKVYYLFFPIAFTVIVAADYIKDHKNMFSCITITAAADRIKLFLGRMSAYLAVGFTITFIGMYLELAIYCFASNFTFPEGYSTLGVMARTFVHLISYSGTMIPFYTAFGMLFTVLFKSALFGIITNIVFTVSGLFLSFVSQEHKSDSMVTMMIPSARYFYPVHGAPWGIESFLYAQDHPEAGIVGFEHFAIAFLCVTLCTVLMFFASYQLENRLE